MIHASFPNLLAPNMRYGMLAATKSENQRRALLGQARKELNRPVPAAM